MSKAPNIILIMVDQLRADILRAYGGGICQTPYLDQFAAESVVFDRAYTPLSVCAPARASVMTGQYPHRHGVTSNGGIAGNGTLHNAPTLLSRQLEQLGYNRMYLGKWHLGGKENLPQHLGLPGDQFPGHGIGGFDFPEFQTYLQQRNLKFAFVDGLQNLGWNQYGTLAGSEEATVEYALAERSIDFLQSVCSGSEGERNPFFLWLNFWGPHSPYIAPQSYLDLYRDVPIPPWPNFPDQRPDRPRVHNTKIPPEAAEQGWPFWEPAVRHYFAFMSLIDRQIGRILACVDKQGLREDTWVIFTADHGESLGAHNCQDKGHFMFEETYRIPFFMRGPGTNATRCKELVSLIDVCPTLLDLAGSTTPEADRDGLSMVSLLQGKTTVWPRSEIVAEFHGLVTPFTQRMIRSHRYKYVWNLGDIDELYDLETDPYEMKNLVTSAEGVGVVSNLSARLLKWMHETHDPAYAYFARHIAHQGW